MPCARTMWCASSVLESCGSSEAVSVPTSVTPWRASRAIASGATAAKFASHCAGALAYVAHNHARRRSLQLVFQVRCFDALRADAVDHAAGTFYLSSAR